ncbi:hypothetical protein [Parafrankia soli]|nr:hypothetical protein [Parafrankia soli]
MPEPDRGLAGPPPGGADVSRSSPKVMPAGDPAPVNALTARGTLNCMRWSTSNGYRVEETIIAMDGGRRARVLRVTRDGLAVGDFAAWGELLTDIDLGLPFEEHGEAPGAGRPPAADRTAA